MYKWRCSENIAITKHSLPEAPKEGITKTCLLKYIENFTTKKGKLSDKKFWYFSYFCSKHRLWVLVKTAYEYPQSMFLSRNNKNNVFPCKPQFYHIKVGFKGVKIIQVCFRDEWWETNDKTNTTHETTDAQAKENCKRWTALERSYKAMR